LLNLEEFRLMQKELDEVGKKLNLKTDSLEANPACSYGNYVPSQGYKFCCAGKSTCTVGFNGDIRPCNRSIMTYGNIKDGLLNSWNKMDDWRSDNWLPNECLICNFKYQCNGGCKADAIKTFGDPQRPDPLCDFSSISLLNQKENIALKLIEKKQFKINPKLKTRKEKFGGILYVQLNKWTPVSVQLFNLFLQNKESMSVDEIGKILSVDSQKAAETATFLFNKQILL